MVEVSPGISYASYLCGLFDDTPSLRCSRESAARSLFQGIREGLQVRGVLGFAHSIHMNDVRAWAPWSVLFKNTF